MFKNDYKDVFGKTYTSGIFDKAQKANNWSLAFTLLYALSKNGMGYASAKSGACSVINNTSLGCACQMDISGPTATSGSLILTFKRLCVKINVKTSNDGKRAYPSGIFVTDIDGTTLATLCKCSDVADNTFTTTGTTVVYSSNYAPITDWSNDPDTDEDKYQVQTATFKDADGTYDCCSMHFWAEDVYLGAIMIFKAKDYFSSKYKYGFGVYKVLNSGTVYKFSDGSDCTIHPTFENAGTFPTKIAKACFFVGSSFSGNIGGSNGIYQITDGSSIVSAFPNNKISVNGREFQAVAPGLFARTS